MRVAQYVYGNPAGEVDQLATGLVPNAGTGATHWNESGRRVVGNHYLVEIGALYRSVLNGHRSLLKRNTRLKLASDGGIVRTVFSPALPPSDNFL
jgi:hypothetical protein